MGVALLIFGVIDIPYQRYEHLKQLKMTKQELKEEYKNNEGRPEVKQRIRQIQQQFARRKIDQAVPKADVVITTRLTTRSLSSTTLIYQKRHLWSPKASMKLRCTFNALPEKTTWRCLTHRHSPVLFTIPLR